MPQESYQLLTVIARIMDTSPAEQIRTALDAYFIQRLNDPDLSAKIDSAKARHAAVLDVLKAPKPAAPEPPDKRPAPRAGTESVSLRLDAEHFSRLTAFALVDDDTLADQLRKAIDKHLKARSADPNLIERIDEVRDEMLQVLGAHLKTG